MSYQGDIAEDATFRFTFNTRTTAGAPITIGGTAAAECYKDSNLTQTGTGVAITEDYDGITGLHQCVMTLTDAFYVAGADYSIVMSVGTVDGQSVVGETIGTFSIENRFMRGTDSALLAANINLTAGAVDNVTTVATTTTNTDMVGTDNALLAASINLTAGAVDNVTTVATTTTNTDMVGTDNALLAASINLTGGAVDTVTTVTNQVTVVDILTTQMAESYAANGTAPTLAQALFAIHQVLMQFGIGGTSNTVRKLDDTATAFVVTLDDDTNPTDAKRV